MVFYSHFILSYIHTHTYIHTYFIFSYIHTYIHTHTQSDTPYLLQLTGFSPKSLVKVQLLSAASSSSDENTPTHTHTPTIPRVLGLFLTDAEGKVVETLQADSFFSSSSSPLFGGVGKNKNASSSSSSSSSSLLPAGDYAVKAIDALSGGYGFSPVFYLSPPSSAGGEGEASAAFSSFF